MKTTIVGMIYKSVAYLDFMLQSLGDDYLIVANDATDEVKQALADRKCNWLDYHDPKPTDYYLNRVYRAWNDGALAADADVIVFFNSDMYGAPGWLENLLKHLTRDTIPCSRLVESGKMPSGKWGVTQDFGRTTKEFRKGQFIEFARMISANCIEDGGLYMPCAFYRDEFLAVGGYPEGNIHLGGEGMVGTTFLRSGDKHLFKYDFKHKRHITVMDSIVYHFQEGERDE